MLKKQISIAFSLMFYCAFAQQDNTFCEQLNSLNLRIQQYHLRPKPLNDSLSKGVFNLFLDRLDENKQFLFQSDILQFKTDEFQLDDAIASENCDFIEKYSTVLQQRIESSKTYISTLEKVDFDYSGKDTLRFKSNRDFGFHKNDSTFKTYWNKRIRYLILDHLIENDSSLSYLEENFKTLESDIKPKIIQNQICLMDEFLHKNGSINNFVKETFLNAFANYQDPNTYFFNDSEKSQFENSVSNHHLTFGIHTEKDRNGNIVISYITPGSAASLNGNFDENDIIKSLTSPTQLLDTFCISNDDVTAFTANDKNETVIFKIKKQNGSVHDIELTKTELKVAENSCTAFLLDEKSNYSYLKIPSFYTNIDAPNGFGLTYDIAEQLQLMEVKKSKGLIIDLRSNGGGSMKEAANLSGLFINKGPLAILKHGNGDTFTVEDGFRGTFFNKPMVILIDNYSASAAEFFTAVMQDYNRAIIVGAKSHGKATTQIILPLSETKNLGFCKLTIEKFYRVTGKSHQSVGIIPDMILPTLLDGFKTNEGYNPFSLLNDSVLPYIKYKPYKKPSLSTLQSKSNIRIENNKSFNIIKNMNSMLLSTYIDRNIEYPLTLSNIYQDVQDHINLWTALNDTFETNSKSILVKNTFATKSKLLNTDEMALNKTQLDDISNDIYIHEALAILNDIGNIKFN